MSVIEEPAMEKMAPDITEPTDPEPDVEADVEASVIDPNAMDLTINPSVLDPEIQDAVDGEENDFVNDEEGSNLNDRGIDDDNDDDDDDDDDIKITIGEIKAPTPPYSGTTAGHTPVNFTFNKRGTNFGPGGQVTSNSGAKSKNIGLNVDAVGTYEGTSIYEFNLDTIEEKPWRKPGADITDYFNYGFTEETWKIYCEKQKRIQQELAGGGSSNGDPTQRRNNNTLGGDRGPPGLQSNGNQSIMTTSHSTPGSKGPNAGGPPVESPIPVASINENSKYTGFGLTKKAGPPPGRKPSGTIDVIGGGTPSTPSVINSRRLPDAPENNFNSVLPGPGMPPGLFHYPPPPFGIMPPHAGMEYLPPPPLPPVPSVTSYPAPHMMGEYSLHPPIKRERDDKDKRDRGPKDKRERDEKDKRERDLKDKRERDEKDKRERDQKDKRERDEKDKRERDQKDKRDRRDRRDSREKHRRSDRETSERRHRDEKPEYKKKKLSK